MTAPSLSIVIPCHRRVDLLGKCLRSLERHVPENTEIIVVDDGSPGGQVSRAATKTKVIRFAHSRGFCEAANAGIQAAKSSIVELLNDDTEVLPGWAKAALRRFADPSVVAVAPLVLDRRNPAIIDSAGDDYDFGGFARKIGHRKKCSELQPEAREVFGASGSSAFYRRDAVLAVGGFPGSFRAYFEDVDLSFRLRRAGGKIVFEPSSRVLHWGGSSFGPPRGRLTQLQSCNEERVFWRNLSNDELRKFLPRHLAVLAGKSLLRLEEGQLLPWIIGRMRAWMQIPADRRTFSASSFASGS